MRKVCFAIPVHEKREVVEDLLNNIRYFCPQVSVVLFQSGTDSKLCEGLGYLVCPTSQPLEYGKTIPWFFFNVMEWLEAINYDYDYLVNIDSDALFTHKGFEEFISAEMDGFEYMATYLREPEPDWYPGRIMKAVWHIWQPIFNRASFLACFTCGQVFSRKLVHEIIHFNKITEIKSLLKQTKYQAFALEEILFPTLVETLGLKSKTYPESVVKWIRFRPYYMQQELDKALEEKSDSYLIHPVYRDINDPIRSFLRASIQNKKSD